MDNNSKTFKGSGYSGTDIISVFRFPEFMNAKSLVFGELSTVSYSFFREKVPVRSIGFTRARGYTKGPRTVAGTLVFTMLNKASINQFAEELYGETKHLSIMPDELPPFSIDINFISEYGNKTRISLIGVEIAEGNQVVSSQNLRTNEQYSFVAQDLVQIDPSWERRG